MQHLKSGITVLWVRPPLGTPAPQAKVGLSQPPLPCWVPPGGSSWWLKYLELQASDLGLGQPQLLQAFRE